MNPSPTSPAAPRTGATGPSLVDQQLVQAHGIASLVMLLAAATFGIIASLELLYPDLDGGVSWLSWGRVRYAHTQGIMFG